MNVLIIDDLPIARQPVKYFLQLDPKIAVTGIAQNGYAKITLVRRDSAKTDGLNAQECMTGKLRIEPLKEEAKMIAIGASMGGPVVLQTILSGFYNHFPLPVMIVQHIAPGFTEGLAEWLNNTTGFSVHVAVLGEVLQSGVAYIAPDGFQMGISDYGRVTLLNTPGETGLCPSVSYLFRSVRQAYAGRSIAILLTGMGKDGAEELKNLKDANAVTFAQDEQSSVVFGMPGEAIRLGGATYVLSPEKIADTVNRLVHSGGDYPATIT